MTANVEVASFSPAPGVDGVLISCTTVGSTALSVPGAGAGTALRLVNGGSVSAFVKLSSAGTLAVYASNGSTSLELLPGTEGIYTSPYDNMKISAITASGTTTVSAHAGNGV